MISFEKGLMYKKLVMLTIFILCTGCNIKKISSSSFETCITQKHTESFNVFEEVGKHPFIIQFQDKKTNLIGFKEKTGKVLISPSYSGAYDFNIYGITDVFDENAWYKINTAGQHLVKSYFFDNGPDYYTLGLSRFEQNGKLGFINLKGEIIIPAQFDWASPFFFSEPISVVCIGCTLKKAHKNDEYPEMKGGKWGGINKKGEIFIPLDFTDYIVDKDGSIVFFKKDIAYKVCRNVKGIFKPLRK